MEHVIMGTILLMTAVMLVVIAFVVCPMLSKLGEVYGLEVDNARYSFALVMVTLAAYLGWVSGLFFADKLGPSNYVLELWVVRIFLLLATIHFARSAYRCKIPPV